MKKKFLSNDKKIGNCPSCRGVLFRDVRRGNPENKISFKMRCPHCQKDTEVIINCDNLLIRIEGGAGE